MIKDASKQKQKEGCEACREGTIGVNRMGGLGEQQKGGDSHRSRCRDDDGTHLRAPQAAGVGKACHAPDLV